MRQQSFLVQCKSTQNPQKSYNSEKAIREFRGAKDSFSRIHEEDFELHLVVSHKGLGRASKQAASEGAGVETFTLKWVKSKLREHRISYADVLQRDAQRRNCRVPI